MPCMTSRTSPRMSRPPARATRISARSRCWGRRRTRDVEPRHGDHARPARRPGRARLEGLWPRYADPEPHCAATEHAQAAGLAEHDRRGGAHDGVRRRPQRREFRTATRRSNPGVSTDPPRRCAYAAPGHGAAGARRTCATAARVSMRRHRDRARQASPPGLRLRRHRGGAQPPRTRDPQDVSIAWTIDAFTFDIPVLAAPMDSVVSPADRIAIGKLGGLGVLDLEGLWTRYDDPEPVLAEIAGAR